MVTAVCPAGLQTSCEHGDLIPDLLTLSDVYGTGWHSAVSAGIEPGDTVTVIGNGAVGHLPAYEQAYGIGRPGGIISRVGVPQYEDAPIGFGSIFGGNVTLTGGPAPARAYIETLMPAILDGVPDGYRAMAAREALKVLVRP